MESKFLKDALFAGMTGNAFKLGTVLTLGWFWQRVCGCSALYRGGSMETIDFDDILTVADIEAEQISPPGYLEHGEGTTYFYVIRRVNGGGNEEKTLSAAVKVSIDAGGNLAKPRPNSIFSVRAQQTSPGEIELVWYYCPVEQEKEPVCFRIYYDAGTGQIDYYNPLAAISYIGRRFYSYRVELPEAGTYQFAVRAADSNGMEAPCRAKVKMQLHTSCPVSADVLTVEAL